MNKTQEKKVVNEPAPLNFFDNSITFNDVFGDKKFKESLDNIVLSMSNPNIYNMMGAKPPRSWLFSGKPGTGKSFTVKAIGNELSALVSPRKVGFLPYDIGTYGTPYINMGSVNLQKYFDSAYDALYDSSNNLDSIILQFDECNSLMSKRGSNKGHKEDDKLLETLMKNLQNINISSLPIYMFFMTNFKDALDTASIRSGRIDREIEFKLPGYNARVNVFNGYINKINNFAKYKVIRNVDVKQLATDSDGFNYADIEAVLDLAIDNKIVKELKTKVKGILPAYYVTHKGVSDALYSIKESKIVDNYNKNKIGFI